MTASASALPREPQVQSRIQKIRVFSRSARAVCAVVIGFGLVGSVVGLFIFPFVGVAAPKGADPAAYDLLAFPLPLKLWWVLCRAAVIGVTLGAFFQLYRLFGNLATGSIYTPENVQRVRRVGLLWLLLAVLHVVVPASLVVANGFFDTPVPMDHARMFSSLGEVLNLFAAAGLVLLASWIMDVGLYEKEHADELRRDSDLMI